MLTTASDQVVLQALFGFLGALMHFGTSCGLLFFLRQALRELINTN